MSASEQGAASPAQGRHGLHELIAERRAKAERLKRADAEAFPYTFPDAEPIARILEDYAHLEIGQETEDAHRVAGRLAARRGSGGAAFLDLVDRSGRIQLHARLDILGEEAFQRLTTLDLGDLLGVEGAAMRSRRGELSPRSSVVRRSNASSPRTSRRACSWILPVRSTRSRNAAPPPPRRAASRPATRWASSVSSPTSRRA